MDNLKRFFVGFLMICIFVSVLSFEKGFVFAGPPLSGDWVVTEAESYYDTAIVLNGNLIVEDGGNLTFRKVTLKMNCAYDGQYGITVDGASFYVLDGSVITSVDPECEYAFAVLPNSIFRMTDSELHECGWPGGWGLIIECSDAVVENSVISNNMEGITIRNDGVVIRNNRIVDNEHIGIAGEGNATIYSNYISGSSSGLELGPGLTLYNNTITLNGAGIGLGEGHAIIRDNVISTNNETGITFVNGASPIITGNNITANAQSGILSKDQCSGVIQGNVITRNGGGIEIGHDCNTRIQGNVITTNTGFGIRCYDNSTLEIHRNDIYGHRDHNIRNDDPAVTINATYNYWGDGPEKISLHVLYEPWLTESIVPSAEITSPLQGETVSSATTVSTEVDAPNGVHKVEFCVDDQLKYTDYDLPYEWNWDTAEQTETEHRITARAHDKFGLETSTSITVLVDNTAPTVSIKEPTAENTYCGMIDVSVNATDNKEIGNVHVKVDNTEWLATTYDPTDFLWKYDLNTTSLSDGAHALMALALDKASNPATTSITLLTDNTPPTLTIEAPQSGVTVGLTLLVKVQASDQAGISRIEFYLQNVLVCTVYETPYQWSWDTTKYPNGEYAITTKAYDTIGNVKTSETTVTVRNVELPWWQTHGLTIIQAFVGIGALVVGILSYLATRRKKRRKKKK